MNCRNNKTSTVTTEEKYISIKTLSETQLQHEKLVTSIKCNLKFEMEKLIGEVNCNKTGIGKLLEHHQHCFETMKDRENLNSQNGLWLRVPNSVVNKISEYQMPVHIKMENNIYETIDTVIFAVSIGIEAEKICEGRNLHQVEQRLNRYMTFLTIQKRAWQCQSQ